MTSPIRVLELRSVRGTGGGPEKTILLGTARADPSRYAITVCYIRDLRDRVFHIDRRAGDLPIDYVEVHERHSFDPGIWNPLRSLIRSRRIDILHSHDYKTDFLALLLSWFEAVVPMATAHGWAGHSFKEEHLYNPGDKRLLKYFPKVVVVSPDMREALIRTGSRPDRVVVIPNGIDDSRFRRAADREVQAREALGLAPGAFVVGAVGRLEAEKNYPLLLRAIARLSGAFPELQLLIAGEGSERQGLEGLVLELGLQGRCRLLGQVPDVIALHHTLDLYVISSDNEGSPNAVLEAMALGTPIVATDVGGVGELARDRKEALLVPRRDEDALVAAIRQSIEDRSGAATRAAGARQRVERELSFALRMERVERIYDELMDRYPGIRQGSRWWRAVSG